MMFSHKIKPSRSLQWTTSKTTNNIQHNDHLSTSGNTMNSKYYDFLLKLGIENNLVKYINDISFLDFCLNWRNPNYKNPATNKDELQSNLIDWIQYLDLNIQICHQIFGIDACLPAKKADNLGLKKILENLVNNYLEYRITDEDIAWISTNNSRLIRFTKTRILFTSITEQGFFPRSQLSPLSMNMNMNHVHGEISPFTSNKSSLEYIKSNLTCIDSPRLYKLGFINSVKQEWGCIVNKDSAARWIKKEDNDSFRHWLKSQDFFMRGGDWNWISQYQHEDFIEFTSLYFDIMTALVPDKSELMIIKLKKAWSQFKTREKNKTKKQVSFYLPIKTKEQLEEICKTTEVPRDKFLQLLIENEYKKFKSKMQEGS